MASKEPALQYRRCTFLINNLYAHGPITREGLMEYWRNDEYANPYGTYEIPLRTFQKTIRAVEDFFPVEIHCNRHTNEYTISGCKEAGMSRTRKVSTLDLAMSRMNKPEVSILPEQLFRIDVLPEEVERLREHPLCPEQREVSVDSETGVTVFEYFMKPTMEWYEAIRSLGIAVKVLYPQWLVDVIRDDMQGIANMYWEDEHNKPGEAGFINPYNCRIVEPKKTSLFLSIAPDVFDEVRNGESENKDYYVIVNPENIYHLMEWDWENDCEVKDEDGIGIPLQYQTIHFKAGNDINALEAIVEVLHTEVYNHIEEDSDNQVQYVTNQDGKVLKDASGNYIPPKFDEQGNCINGTLWEGELVCYKLGKVLKMWAKE